MNTAVELNNDEENNVHFEGGEGDGPWPPCPSTDSNHFNTERFMSTERALVTMPEGNNAGIKVTTLSMRQ